MNVFKRQKPLGRGLSVGSYRSNIAIKSYHPNPFRRNRSALIKLHMYILVSITIFFQDR